MLRLRNIQKDYIAGDTIVHALKNINIDFRKSEFVAILGPSGCGKTTLLNIIGGLDRYTTGDLSINGTSTKEYKDGDWDVYRNRSIGFVFQNYNLIPHQTVVANVELAMTLSGVSKKERRRRAIEALEKVGLSDQAYKKPNQMSGGQMQRVAIARALVNNPDILLADEPTGALDTQTSVQVMEILREIAKEKLIIMVTHNAELADTYATRTVRVLDGEVVADTNPVTEEPAVAERKKEEKKKTKKTSMSLFTAISLSVNNLMTKKARTFLTSFAGSIGIIGIALILALSNGIQAYIDEVQENTLSSYPITILREEANVSDMISALTGNHDASERHENDAVYAKTVLYDLFNTMINVEKTQNNLKEFKEYLESENNPIRENTTSILYTYDMEMNIYATDTNGKYVKSDYEALMEQTVAGMTGGSSFQMPMMENMTMMNGSFNIWQQLLPGENGEAVHPLLKEQFDLVGEGSRWPEKEDEIILVLDKYNEITDITQYALGLMSADTIIENTMALMQHQELKLETTRWEYSDILGRTFKLVLSTDLYSDADGDGIWDDLRNNDAALDLIVSNGKTLKIVGIVRPSENVTSTALKGGVLAYTQALTNTVIEGVANSEIYHQQSDPANKNFDIFTGLPFTEEQKEPATGEALLTEANQFFASLNLQEKVALYRNILCKPINEELDAQVSQMMSAYPDRATLEKVILEQLSKEAGMNSDKIKEYLTEYSDEALREMVASSIRNMLLTQYETAGQATLDKIVSQPNATELAMLKAQYQAKLTDRNAKIAFIAAYWSSSISMNPQAAAQYLATQKDSEIDRLADETVTAMATADYAAFAALQKDAEKDQKIADAFDLYFSSLDEEAIVKVYQNHKPATVSSSSLAENLKKLGAADTSSPASIALYTNTFAAKDAIAEGIAAYNAEADEDDRITYTDYVAIIMSSITTIINAISYVLIAFVAISLIVSSIMIGIITYVSVLERTKEIGILRAIGASKRDISRVFNAETLLIGFGAGAFGVLATVLLCIPINMIIRHYTEISSLGAALPFMGGLLLMIISMALTLVAGLIPSRIAAKKDPVVALRSE